MNDGITLFMGALGKPKVERFDRKYVIKETGLDAAIEHYKNELRLEGHDGVYEFSCRWMDKEFYLKGYPFKK